MKSVSCPNTECVPSKEATAGSIIRHGFYNTNSGRRCRYRCRTCGKTFCSNASTPYYRLQHRRAPFDQVAALSVKGLNKSAIARVKQIAWNTVDRWLERAAHFSRRFNDRKTDELSIAERQADEIRTRSTDKIWPAEFEMTEDVLNTHYIEDVRYLRSSDAASEANRHEKTRALGRFRRTCFPPAEPRIIATKLLACAGLWKLSVALEIEMSYIFEDYLRANFPCLVANDHLVRVRRRVPGRDWV
jgi:transposase-like protein